MPRFSPASASTYFKPKDFPGALLLLEPLGVIRDYVFPGSKDAPRDAMRANVYVLSDPGGAKFFEQTITQSVLVNSMRQASDPFVLGRLTKGDTAWLLGAPSSEDEATANAFLDKLDAQPGDSAAANDEVPF